MTETGFNYVRVPKNSKFYLAHVVGIENTLNFHLEILGLTEEEKRIYSPVLQYEYEYVSEEAPNRVLTGTTYSCHLREIELSRDPLTMKEAYVWTVNQVHFSLGWVLVSLGDIDVYRRLLINMFDLFDRKSINLKLLNLVCEKTGLNYAQKYVRPRNEKYISPETDHEPVKHYIIYNSKKN